MDLSAHKQQILELNPLGQTLNFNPAHWLNYSYANQQITDEIESIVNCYVQDISRSDIIEFVHSNPKELLRAFLMTMIWGHGSAPGGRVDNRGPWKVNEMTADLSRCIQTLEEVSAYIKDQQLEKAFHSFKWMPRIRVNFFSKFFYFLGRAKEVYHYPLIFDQRVAIAISKKNSLEEFPNRFLVVSPGQGCEDYINYVDYIHLKAKELGVPAENLEYYLFQS